MRRLTALIVALMLVALAVGPAAACARSAMKSCCCKAPPTRSFCARSCCDPPTASRTAELATDLPTLATFATPSATTAAMMPPLPRAKIVRFASARIGLHQRAAPRLPLRI